MNLTRYEPADFMSGIQEDINNLFRSRQWGNKWMSPLLEESSNILGSDWMPSVDIKEEDSQFIVKADVPGVEIKDIDVTMDNGFLSIKGERQSEKKEDKEGYHRVERSYGAFHRRFSLPETADPDKVTAKVKDGVLEILIGKQKAAKARKVTIQT